MTNSLLDAPRPAVADEELDVGVSQEGGLGQPGGGQHVLWGVRHRQLPLPDHFLLQPGEDSEHHLPLVLRHGGGLEDGAEGDQDDPVLGGLNKVQEVAGQRRGRPAGHQAGRDGLGGDRAEAVTQEGGAVVDVESWGQWSGQGGIRS